MLVEKRFGQAAQGMQRMGRSNLQAVDCDSHDERNFSGAGPALERSGSTAGGATLGEQQQ